MIACRGIIYEGHLNKRAPHTPITMKLEKEERRERARARERPEGETRETTRYYAALLMKQSPLRPCYLDVRTRSARIMLRGFGGRVQPSRRRARFPVGPLGASGPGPGSIDESRLARRISDTKLNRRVSSLMFSEQPHRSAVIVSIFLLGNTDWRKQRELKERKREKDREISNSPEKTDRAERAVAINLAHPPCRWRL